MVDDETLVLDSLERILASETDITVVGTATTGEEAIPSIRSLKPDVVLMDLLLKGNIDGVQATQRIRNSLNPPAIVAVTSFDLDSYLHGALQAGATGFLLKTDASEYLARAIRMAHAGDPMISPEMTSKLIKSYVAPAEDPVVTEARSDISVLSEREIKAATLIGEGNTYSDIAKELFISESTVKSTIRSGLNKLDVATGAQLAVRVAQARLDLAD